MSSKSSKAGKQAKARSVDTIKLIGILLIVASVGFFLWKRSSSSSSKAAGNSGTKGEAELLNIKWRQRSPVDRPAPGAAADAFSAVETEAGSPSTDAEVARQLSLVDPAGAGWETEAFNDVALAKLKQIGKALGDAEADRLAVFDELLVDGFTSTPLKSGALERIDQGGRIIVERAESASLAIASLSEMDAAQFDTALGQLLGSGEARLSFKIVRVRREGDVFHTRVMFEAFVRDGDDSRQVNSIWTVTWSGGRLASLRVESFEQVKMQSETGAIFADVTASAFAGVESFSDQFLRDNVHWAGRLSVIEGTSLIGHVGVVIGDINGDGLDDLYVPDGGGLPNRMYVQKPDGTLRDVSAESGTDWLEYTPSALLLDLDNDGDQDLVASTVQMILLMENDGSGKFKLAGARSGAGQARTMCAADYDLDGDLDLYICNYAIPNTARGFGAPGVVSSFPLPYNDANNGGPNLLLENRGKFQFADVTAEVGLDQNNSRYSLSAAWEDFDQDGDPDLAVANDFGRNNLYRNDRGSEPGRLSFTDISASAGVEDIASGMSVAWGDYDRDGRSDLYISNMFSSAGGRVTFQRQFGSGRSEVDVANFQRLARGNTLFRTGGDGTFTDVSEAAGVTMGRWAWTSKFADFNNDGWLDIIVGNGFVTGKKTNDL